MKDRIFAAGDKAHDLEMVSLRLACQLWENLRVRLATQLKSLVDMYAILNRGYLHLYRAHHADNFEIFSLSP